MKREKLILIFLTGMATFSYFSSRAIASYFSSNAISAKRNSEGIAERPVASLALSNLDENLLSQSVELRQEVEQALEEVGQDDVGCVAPLIRRPFTDLNNTRIAPFSCFFTDNGSLIIQAENLAILPNGEIIQLEELLKRNGIPQGVLIQFSLTSWQWTDANY
ncbi:hypothetical protein H6F93_08960 [Leptolyngbya sp. FACHB-671]|nr:hypothetical protein [Leptolyngbya sp. FACHB-671]